MVRTNQDVIKRQLLSIASGYNDVDQTAGNEDQLLDGLVADELLDFFLSEEVFLSIFTGQWDIAKRFHIEKDKLCRDNCNSEVPGKAVIIPRK